MTQTDPTALQRPRSNSFRQPLVATVIAVLAVALVVGVVRRPRAPVRARSLGAKLELSAGEVTVREGERAFGAPSGTPLAVGSRVQTAKGSRALVRTGDGAGIFLRGESEIGLDPQKIELVAGEIWLDVPRLEGVPTLASTGSVTVTASNAGLDLRRAGEEVSVYVARGLAVLRSTRASKPSSNPAPHPRCRPSRSSATGPEAWPIPILPRAPTRPGASTASILSVDPGRRRARSR
jgi:ferric-dicitrate binding protein FerR (iron transport regulator)